MREREEELAARNIRVVVITFETGSLAQRYVEDTGLKWPLLVDETRALYRACDMLAAGFWDIWGLPAWRAYLKEMAHGHWPHRPSGDIRQRGGDVLIDPAGMVRLHHVGAGPADRPQIDAILHSVQ